MSPASSASSVISRRGRLRRRLAQGTALGALLAAAPVAAQTIPNPGDGTPTAGATITRTGDTLTVNLAALRTVIDWKKFDIGTGQTIEFRDALATPLVPMAVLNRVVGPGAGGGGGGISQSDIKGTLVSDPNIAVYLLNPQGVLFGTDARVNVGSLIVATRGTTNAEFLAGGPMTFTGTSDGTIQVKSGAEITALTKLVNSRGVIALIGAKIDTRGTLKAPGEIALVAADTTTINLDPASPLGITIAEGTALTDPILAKGSLSGSSVLLAAATRGSVTSALLDVQATVTATTAFATDQGIVLAAGPTTATAANVTMPSGAGSDNSGNLSLTLGGTLTATGAAGGIDVRAINGVAKPGTAATLDADQGVLVRADAGGVVLGDVTSRLVSATAKGVDLSAGTGAITAGAVAAGVAATPPAAPGSAGARASVVASAGSVTLASLFAGGDATLSGTALTLGSATSEGGTLDLLASTGNLTATTLTALGRLTAEATAGDLLVDTATSQASSADLTVRAVNVSGRTGSRATLSAGRDLALTASGAAKLASANAGRDVVLSATVLDATSVGAGRKLDATATTGALTLVTGTAGTVATLRAATDATLGTVDAARIDAGATDALTATRLTATQTGSATDAVRVDAAALAVTTAEATQGVARLTSNSGAASVGTLNAGIDATLSAATTATLANAAVGRDLTVSGANVRLGGGAAPTQVAGRTAAYAARTGTIAGVSAATGLSIRADAGGAGTGAIILDAPAGIDLPSVGLATGDPAGSVNSGVVGLRLGGTASLTLGTVDASALQSVNAAHDTFTPLITGGDVTLGATRLVDRLTLQTPGAISLGGIAISGLGQDLIVQGTGLATTLTAGGTLSAADGAVSVTAPGAVTLENVSAPNGAVQVQSTGSSLTAGALAGRQVTASAATDLMLGSVQAGAGTASLTATAGTLKVSGATQAMGQVTLDAPGAITVGDVRSTGADVRFLSSSVPATGALTAGAVRSVSDLVVARAAGLTFGSATSDNGSVSLAATAGVVKVTGATAARDSVTLSGQALALGSVLATNAAATLTAATTIGATGAIQGAGTVTLDAPGTITVGDVRSTGADVRFISSSLPATGALTASAVRSASDIVANRPAGLTFGSATSDNGSISLTATAGTVKVTGATAARSSVAMSGQALALGSVLATNGTASFSAATTIAASDTIQAGSTVTLDAPGVIAVGDVRSTGADVRFVSSILPVTGTLTAGAVRSFGDLVANRPAGLTFGSATSDNGSVTLSAFAGMLRVTGATTARNAVAMNAQALALGSVLVTNGPATLTAATTIGTSDAIQATGTVTLDAPGAITVGDVRSTGADVRFLSSGAPATGALTAGGVQSFSDLVVARATGLTFGSATSDNGSVSLSATGGTVKVTGATTALNSVALNGLALALGSVFANNGAATLTSATTITASDAIQGTGAVTLDAPGTIAVGDVRSTGSTVSFVSTVPVPTGAITAGLVRAAGDLTVVRAPSFTFSGLTSDTGRIALTTGGVATVTGATKAQTSVSVDAGTIALAGVTATTGGVVLNAQTGALTTGALFAGGGIDAKSLGTLTFAGAEAAGGPASFQSSAGLSGTAALKASGDIVVKATGPVSLQTVTGSSGVTLSSGAGLTVGALVGKGAVSVDAVANAQLASATSTNDAVFVKSLTGRVDIAGALSANRLVSVDAATDAQLASVTNTGSQQSVLKAVGTLTVTGATTLGGGLDAQGAAGITLGTLTSTLGTVSVTSANGAVGAGTVTTSGALSVLGRTGVTLASARTTAGPLTLSATAGPLSVAGAVRGFGDVLLTARDAIALTTVSSDTGGITVASSAGSVGATTLGAPGLIDVAGAGGVALTSATSTAGGVALRASAGTVAANTVRAATDALVQARDGVTVANLRTDAGAATLRSSAGAIQVTAATTGTGLDADAATTLSLVTANIGGPATLAGADIALGSLTAGSLNATARGGSLQLGTGDIAGAAAISKTGAAGGITLTRLTAGGPNQITSAGFVRADLLGGGATRIDAVGDVTSDSGGVDATLTSLEINAGTITTRAITTTGDFRTAATGALNLSGATTVGGDLTARGDTVTLGRTGQTITQAAAGRIQVTSTGGAITGLTGLTLRSDSGGAGGRDATLQSAAGLVFQSGTLLAGGPDRQSAVRLQAVGAIALDVIEARTIASPGAATVLTHSGPLTAARIAARDTLAITLVGSGNPALNVGTVEVRAGDLSLDAAGALSVGTLNAAAGATTLAGATLNLGPVTTGSLAATARKGAATFTTIDATLGGAAVQSTGDLRVARVTAKGAVLLDSSAGDVFGDTLTSAVGSVTARAGAAGGTRGAVLLGTVAGAGGVDLSGRTITADAVSSSGGGIAVSTRLDLAGLTDQRVTIGTIDALGTVSVATGNGAAATNGAVALDRATSTGGNIAITTIGGGLTARTGTAGTVLQAPAGAITLGVGGAATLQAATAKAITVSAARLDVTAATATGGALALTARTGPLQLGTGIASGAATLDSAGLLTVTSLTAGSATLNGAGDATLKSIATAAGLLKITTVGALDAVALDSAGGILVDAGSARVTDATARSGALDLTSRTGPLQLGTGTASGAALLTAAGPLTVTSLTASSATLSGAGDASLEAIRTTSGLLKVTTAGALNATTLDSAAGVLVDAGTARLGSVTARGGAVDVTARTGTLRLDTGAASGDAALTAPMLSIGKLDGGGAIAVTATGDIAADRLTAGTKLTAVAGGGAKLDTVQAGGDASLSAGNVLSIAKVTTPSALVLAGRTLAVTALDAATLRATSGLGGTDLRNAKVANAATLISTAGIALGTLDAGTLGVDAAGALRGDSVTVRTGLTVTAADVQLTTTRVGGAVRIGTGAGPLVVTDLKAGGDVDFTTTGALGIGTLDVGGRLIATGGTTTITAARVTGAATLAASGGDLQAGQVVVGGDAAITAPDRAGVDTLDVGGRLSATGTTLALGTTTVRGSAASISGTTVQLGSLTANTGALVTARGVLTADRIDAGTAITANAGSAAIGQANARAGDLALTTNAGDLRLGAGTASGAVGLTSSGAATVTGAVRAGTAYRIDAASIALGAAGATAGQAGADVALTARTGAVTAQGNTTLTGTRAVAITVKGTGGAIGFAPETSIVSSTGDITLATTGAAALGTVGAAGGAIRLDAADATLTRAVTAKDVTITNVAGAGITRLGDMPLGNESDFAAATPRFDLSAAEMGLISAPTVTIASGARDVAIGTMNLAPTTGSTRFAVTASGRIDVMGRFVAAGSAPTRVIAFGNVAGGSRTAVIRIAATQGEGGRILVDGATLDLTAERIGAGLERDFLASIGYRTTDGLSVEQANREYVSRPSSTLYNAGALGAAPYTDGVLVRAATLRLDYGRYALFQNTGRPGEQAGVVLGGAGMPGAKLMLNTPGSQTNAFELFGTIDGIGSQATALLGPDRVSVGVSVSPTSSRINGCVIGSGAGCLTASIAQPTLGVFDSSRAEIVRTADDLSVPFDPLIGTNNEALYLDAGVAAAAAATNCESDKPCTARP